MRGAWRVHFSVSSVRSLPAAVFGIRRGLVGRVVSLSVGSMARSVSR